MLEIEPKDWLLAFALVFFVAIISLKIASDKSAPPYHSASEECYSITDTGDYIWRHNKCTGRVDYVVRGAEGFEWMTVGGDNEKAR